MSGVNNRFSFSIEMRDELFGSYDWYLFWQILRSGKKRPALGRS